MGEDQLSDLKAAFARLEGTLTTEVRHLAHDVKNVNMTIEKMAENYVPRREIENNRKADIDRIEKLEENQTFFGRQAIMQWLGGTIVAGTLAKKIFF